MLKTAAILLLLWTQDTGLQKSDPPLVGELESMATRVISTAEPFIVSIKVTRDKEADPPKPGGRNRPTVFRKRPGHPTSGTIISPDGFIVTSYFNVSGKTHSIKVSHGTKSYDAELVGYNGTLDVAILKIDAEGLPAPVFANMKDLKVGQPVYALGRGPDGKRLTFDAGVISALDRYRGRMLQHVGSANFGNSGGPLVDSTGRICGITCNITTGRADRFGQNSGISFAARWDKIQTYLPKMKAGAKIKVEMRPYLGVTLNQEYRGRGVGIDQVQAGTAAEKGGLENGDVIIQFGEEKINEWSDLITAIRSRKAGDQVIVKVLRKGKEIELEVTLGEAPEQ